MSAKDRRARYETAHPDWTRAQRRRKQRRHLHASRILREQFRAEYASLRDPSLPAGNPRIRAAMKALRERHPAEWQEALEQARRQEHHD